MEEERGAGGERGGVVEDFTDGRRLMMAAGLTRSDVNK